MDNVTPIDSNLHRDIPDVLTSTITLDSFQHSCYKEGWLTINAPDGNHLETLGQLIHDDEAVTNALSLQNQLYLLEYLLLNIDTNIELPKQAVFALVDIFSRMRVFCDEHVK